MTGHKLMNARGDSCRPVRDDQKDRPSLPVLADAPDRGWCRSVGRYAPPRINPLTAPTAHIHGEWMSPARREGFQFSGSAPEYGLVWVGRMPGWLFDSSISRSVRPYACPPVVAMSSSQPAAAELVVL